MDKFVFHFESTIVNLDSIETTNQKNIKEAAQDVNTFFLSTIDSSILITTSKYSNHRIFGYQQPNINSKKLILISCFTGDVESKPFELPLGSYYEFDENHQAKYLKSEQKFH